MDYTILVNKKYGIKKDLCYELIPIKSLYKDGMLLEKETYEHWLELKSLALNKGYHIEIKSAYRSCAYQAKVLNEIIVEKGKEYASKAVAKPGHSEHQTGLALDYCLYKNGQFIEEHDIILYRDSKYVNSHAHQYGFIVRYPKGKENITGYQYEPWHLRYVGEYLATYLYENNLTLDEYYLKKGKK